MRERLRVRNTGNPTFDGMCGYYAGKALVDQGPFPNYLILVLDEPFEDALAVVLPEMCLERG